MRRIEGLAGCGLLRIGVFGAPHAPLPPSPKLEPERQKVRARARKNPAVIPVPLPRRVRRGGGERPRVRVEEARLALCGPLVGEVAEHRLEVLF